MLFFLFAVAFGLAPLVTVDEPVDQDGLRQYIVLLSQDAPPFGRDLGQLRNWVKQDLSAVDPDKISECWSIGNFAGFPAWLTSEGVQQLRQHSYVRLIEEAQKIHIPLTETPSNVSVGVSPLFRPDWGQMRSQQKPINLLTEPAGLYTEASISVQGYPSGAAPNPYDPAVPGSWNWNAPFGRPTTGSGAHIWIIDTGVNYMHQEFLDSSGLSRVTVRTDCSGDGPCHTPTVDDLSGHGTHCAGSAGGKYRGMAIDASLGSIRVFNDDGLGITTWAIRGVEYAVNNKISGKFNIVSMSLGAGKTQALDDAVDAAWQQGIFVAVAAGNNGGDACSYSPANSTVVVVGATTAYDSRASFSNYGPCVEIFAPGVAIQSAWAGAPNLYATISGTSMATPLVAGSVALYVTGKPNATPNSARSALYNYAAKDIVIDARTTPNRFLYAQFKSTLDEE